jgi:hypothetical protein
MLDLVLGDANQSIKSIHRSIGGSYGRRGSPEFARANSGREQGCAMRCELGNESIVHGLHASSAGMTLRWDPATRNVESVLNV